MIEAPVDLTKPRDIHVVGVGGAGMSAIAIVLREMGHRVSGSDLRPSSVLSRLEALGIRVHVGHDASNLGEADLVAISSAVARSNSEVVAASRAGLPVVARSEILSSICATKPTLAVAGTHGKTTTSSMLALILVEAGLSPSFIIGGDIASLGTGALWGSGSWLVVEADESDGTFLDLPAHGVIVTSVEPDHIQHYGTFEALVAAFERFVSAAPGPKVLCAQDPVSAALFKDEPGYVTYGFKEGVSYRATSLEMGRSTCRFEVSAFGEDLGEVRLSVPGRHNVLNAMAALAMASELGVDIEASKQALTRYGGVGRRFEFRGQKDGVTYVDDYAHLPGEIRAALGAASDGGFQRVVAVFQPHRYSRTEALWHDFAEAFEGADVVVITEIYSAGEAPRPGVSGRLVAEAVADANPGLDVRWAPTKEEAADAVRSIVDSGDVCLTLGAGDLTGLPSFLLGEMDRW